MSPEVGEKISVGAISSLVTLLLGILSWLLKRGKNVREGEQALRDGFLAEIERLRAASLDCHDEKQGLLDQMQRLIESTTQVLQKFEEQVKLNFENRRTIYDLQSQIKEFNDKIESQKSRFSAANDLGNTGNGDKK